jgi:hypothetical protein
MKRIRFPKIDRLNRNEGRIVIPLRLNPRQL